VDYLPFVRKIELVRALIGKTPDDGIWEIVKSLGKLRNENSHSRFTGTAEGIRKITETTAKILSQVKSVRSITAPEDIPDLEIICFSAASAWAKSGRRSSQL